MTTALCPFAVELPAIARNPANKMIRIEEVRVAFMNQDFLFGSRAAFDCTSSHFRWASLMIAAAILRRLRTTGRRSVRSRSLLPALQSSALASRLARPAEMFAAGRAWRGAGFAEEVDAVVAQEKRVGGGGTTFAAW